MAEEEEKKEDDNSDEEEKSSSDEEKKPKEETSEGKVVNEAKEIVAGMKKENDRKEKLLEREEKLQAKKETLQALGGGSLAGDRPEKKEETDKEYSERVMKNDL